MTVRHGMAVGLVAILMLACGNGSDDSSRDDLETGDPAAAGEPSSLGPSAYVKQIAGLEDVLVVDGETRATEFVSASESATSVEVSGSSPVPGDGPLINITGAQVGADQWVVAGNDCDTVEFVDPASCSPGTLTLAILEGDSWVEVEDLPSDFTSSFVSVYSASNGRVLLGRWDRGDSRYWLLDVEDRSLDRVDWAPPALDLGDALVVDSEMNAGGQTRMACLVEDRLVVIDAREGSVLEAQITVVDISRPDAATVADESVTVVEATAQMPLVCQDGHAPYLIATDADGAPLAYEIALADATVGPPIPSGLGAGPLNAITYGPGTVAVQQADPAGTAAPGGTIPAGPDAPPAADDSATPLLPADRVAVFRDGRWQLIGTEAGVTPGQVALPLGDPELPLVVADRGRDATYRLVEVG